MSKYKTITEAFFCKCGKHVTPENREYKDFPMPLCDDCLETLIEPLAMHLEFVAQRLNPKVLRKRKACK